MFGLFRNRTEQQKLTEKYNRLMKEAFELSRINRAESDRKYSEAYAVQKELERSVV